MISLNKRYYNTQIEQNQITDNPESGITLMLAVLVLAAVTAVAFSLATIVFIEIRAAGDSFRTEPALYATLAVTEEALFQYKRFGDPDAGINMDVPSCEPQILDVCNINGVNLSMPGDQPIAFDESPRVEFISAGQTKTFPMYIANDFSQQYESVQIDVLPNDLSQGVDLFFEITQEDETEPQPGPSDTVAVGTPYTYSGFDTEGQYDLIITNPSQDQDVSIVITTVRVDDQTPSGLPFIGEQVLRIMADYAGLTRTYQVRIPIP